ncbi:hypothetical protein BDR26DRAFT_859706 [Obelidium mucronatum]|nr:hypothetical protein BDR26DRAFT_859706 [Obelidium mucronatum]
MSPPQPTHEALQQQQQRQQQQQAPNPSSHTPTKRDTTRIPNKHTTTTTTTTTTKSKRSRTYKRRGTAGLRSCANCSSTETSVWRKAKKTGETLCNPCGVYQNAHGGKPRPLELKKDSIHSRKRKAGGGAGSISKKQNRKQKRKSALSDTEDEEEEEDEEEDYEMDSENDDAELAPDFKKSCDTEESKDWMLKFGG